MDQKNRSLDINRYLLLVRRLVYGFIHFLYMILPPLKNNLVVLNYHGIGNNAYRFDVPEDSFKEQIRYLISQGYIFISAAQLEQWLESKNIPNGLYALLTFDDGNRSVLKIQDFLKENGIKPVFFVLTDSKSADKKVLSPAFEPVTDSELVNLQRENWEIGAHSATHPYLPNIIDETSLDQEIFDSKKILEKTLGARTNYFAYPHGGYSQKVIHKVVEAGFKIAFSTDEDVIYPYTNKFTIPRVGINKTHSLTEFKAVVTPINLCLKPLIKNFYE